MIFLTYWKKILLLFLVFVSAAVFAGEAEGKEDRIGISIDQAVFSFDLAPGEKKTFKAGLENIAEEKQQMTVFQEDFSIADNNATSLIDGENEIYGMKNWISFPEKNWFLEGKEKKTLELELAVPENAGVGSHYAAVLIRATPVVTGENFERSIVAGQAGIYVLVNVKGEVSGKGKITKFEAPIFAGKKISMKTEFENDGSVHYIPHGEINIKNVLTRKNSKVDVEKHFVFPGKKYSFLSEADIPSVLGIYVANASFVDGESIRHNSKRIIFGKYAAVTIFVLLLILAFFGKLFHSRYMVKK